MVRTICFGRKRLLDRGTFLRAAVRWSVPDFLPADFFLRVVFFFVAMRWSLSGGIGRCGRKTLAASRGPGSPISDGTAFSRNPWTVFRLPIIRSNVGDGCIFARSDAEQPVFPKERPRSLAKPEFKISLFVLKSKNLIGEIQASIHAKPIVTAA